MAMVSECLKIRSICYPMRINLDALIPQALASEELAAAV